MKQINLTRGAVSIVDNEDYEKFGSLKWYCSSNGYAQRNKRINGRQKTISMHRLIINAKQGEFVDHINMNKLDNRKENLRICTKSQNGANRNKNNNKREKYKGVYKNTKCNTYKACIRVNNKTMHLGSFKTQIEAAIRYNKAAEECFGEYAKINEI